MKKTIDKRVYNSKAREAQAEETKSRILEAAKVLFQQKGFDQVTIGELAEAAAVSMPTVYAVFKSKRGVLQSLIDTALPQDQFEHLVHDSMKENLPERRLQATAKLARKLYDAEKELMDILKGASVVSPELRKLEVEREERRYDRQGEYVKQLKKDGHLLQGLTLQKARDTLWALTGRDMYRMFVIERSWSSNAYEKWLADILVKSLLDS